LIVMGLLLAALVALMLAYHFIFKSPTPAVTPAAAPRGTQPLLHYALLIAGGGCLLLAGITLVLSLSAIHRGDGLVPIIWPLLDLLVAAPVGLAAFIVGLRGVLRARNAATAPPTGGAWKTFLKIVLLAVTCGLVLLSGAILFFNHVVHRRNQQGWNVSIATPALPTPPTAPFTPPTPVIPAPPAPPVPFASVSPNDFDLLVEQARRELDRQHIRFDQLQVSSPNEAQLFISPTGLQARQTENGAEVWQNLVGLFAGTRDASGQWHFLGQGQLAGTEFSLPKLDLNEVLAAAGKGPNPSPKENQNTHDRLAARLAVAEKIQTSQIAGETLTSLAVDAAKAGDVEIVKSALEHISDGNQHDIAAHDAALLLAKAGYRAQAINIAQGIGFSNIHDQTMAELAQ